MPVYYGMFLLGSLYTQRYVCVNYYYLRLALNMFFFFINYIHLKETASQILYVYIYCAYTKQYCVLNCT